MAFELGCFDGFILNLNSLNATTIMIRMGQNPCRLVAPMCVRASYCALALLYPGCMGLHGHGLPYCVHPPPHPTNLGLHAN